MIITKNAIFLHFPKTGGIVVKKYHDYYFLSK